jgi:DNA (cytosine-5)-methyltransferase 1
MKENKLIELTKNQPQGYRIYDANGVSVTLASQAGGLGAKTGLYQIKHGCCKGGYRENDFLPTMTKSAFQENVFVAFNPYNKSKIDNFAPTQTTRCGDVTSSAAVLDKHRHGIRKLTPLECFRLMGFSDADFDACKTAGISDSQIYKQAGNSIVVNVLMAIFGELYGIDWKPIVYGNRFKTEKERYNDLPLFTKGGQEK